jgi:hypothetical protein
LLRRLATIDIRSVEQPVDLDDGDDVFDWPFLVASNVGSFDLTTEQAAKLRDYLERGGFLLCDSFFGTQEWQTFEATLRKVFNDLGDSWQNADDPQYPQENSNLGIRLAVSFAIYDLTH